MTPAVEQRSSEIAALCRRFGVRSLEVFGSAATGAFEPGRSDVDLLVDFGSDPQGNLFSRYFGLKEGLEQLLGCQIDLVMVGALRNPFFIASVNKTRQALYAAPIAETA